MNTKTIIAGVIGGIAFFLLGWLIWGMLLVDTMDQYSNTACMKPDEEMNMAYIAVASLVWGFLYAYIFSNWTGFKTFTSGLLPGALINMMVGLAWDLSLLSMTTMITNTTVVGIDIAANGVMGAIVGGVVCWWLGRSSGARGSASPA
jgi:hypothetical protein